MVKDISGKGKYMVQRHDDRKLLMNISASYFHPTLFRHCENEREHYFLNQWGCERKTVQFCSGCKDQIWSCIQKKGKDVGTGKMEVVDKVYGIRTELSFSKLEKKCSMIG